ncbi:MAG: PAS domain-containing protein [Bacteroidales bacterium]
MTDKLTKGKKQLFDEKQLLYTLIDNMPDFIYLKDTDSKFIVANQKLIDVHNLKSRDQLIGRSDHDFYPKELADKYKLNEQTIIHTGKPLINHEERSLDEKGNTIYLSTTKIPLHDADGTIIGIVGIGRDITDKRKTEEKLLDHADQLQQINALLEEKQEEVQQQAEELSAQADNLRLINQELEKLSAAVSETDNVVIILDEDGNFEWVNNSFTRVYGYTLDQFIQERGKNMLEGSHNPEIKDILAKCRDSCKTIRYHTETMDKDGNVIWTQSTLTPVLNAEKKIIRFVAVDTDITAVKKAQDMVNNHKAEIELQRDQLEKANITKDKFFSIIAHDLKNPFHSIMGFTDLLIKNYNDFEDTKKLEFLGLINESSQYANNLLDNLLHWSRTQTDRIKYSPIKFDLHSLVNEIQHMLHGNAEKKQLALLNLVPEASYVYADKNMIHTVLRNLVSNSIKFTPAEGTISIEAIPKEEFIHIIVKDNGVGIPLDQHGKLFSFGEFHSTSGTAGEPGTGLGLIICFEFIKKHGRELSFSSESGKGTSFTFVLASYEPSINL